MATPAQKVALVIGASRGIGRQFAVDLARNDYKVAVAAKSTTAQPGSSPPDPNSVESTVTTVAHEITTAGGSAIPIQVDTRSHESVSRAVDETVRQLGRIDLLVYNAGAIWWSSVQKTSVSRFTLMQRVNIDGLYAAVAAVLPHFEAQGWKGRIVVVSPPIYSRFFRGKTAYAIGKIGMSVLTKGLAMDWIRDGKTEMAITSIWPATAVQSGATRDLPPEVQAQLRKATIMSDALLQILKSSPESVNGQLLIDEDYLRQSAGMSDFSHYSLIPGTSPPRMMPSRFPDLTVPEQDDEGVRRDSSLSTPTSSSRL